MPTTQKLKKWGNSQGIIISSKQCELLGWHINDPIEMVITCENAPILQLSVSKKRSRIGVLKNFAVPSEDVDTQLDSHITAMFSAGDERGLV